MQNIFSKNSMFKETKTRSIVKTIGWRLIAVINSFLILVLSTTTSPIINALLMNLTGAFLYFAYERVWNKIKRGKEQCR